MKQPKALFVGLGLALVAVFVLRGRLPVPVEAAVSGQAGDGEVNLQAGSAYLFIAGNAFVSDSSSTQFKANAVGGVSITGSTDRYMHAPILLPDGAVIYGIRFYYYDGHDPGYMRARLVRHNDPDFGARTIPVSIASPGPSAGYASLYQAAASPISIDNTRYNYELEVHWSTPSLDLRLMGVRVFYSPPV